MVCAWVYRGAGQFSPSCPNRIHTRTHVHMRACTVRCLAMHWLRAPCMQWGVEYQRWWWVLTLFALFHSSQWCHCYTYKIAASAPTWLRCHGHICTLSLRDLTRRTGMGACASTPWRGSCHILRSAPPQGLRGAPLSAHSRVGPLPTQAQASQQMQSMHRG